MGAAGIRGVPRPPREFPPCDHVRQARHGHVGPGAWGAALEQQVDDVNAVMDAAGSSRASVARWADGAFMAAMFAATYPERVSALVLGGLWLKALAGPPATLAPDPDVAQRLSEKIESGWRHGALAEVLAPSYANDQRFRSWWRRWEVYSATPAAAAGLLRWAATFDPAPILPAIQAPTLVLERSATYQDHDSRRLAAAQIPDGRYVQLPGADTLPYLGDADALLDEIEEFLTGARGTIGAAGAWPPSCSPTSSAQPIGPAGSVTGGGGICWRTITRMSGGSLPGSVASRSTPPVMGSSPPSTARPGPSVALVPSATPSPNSACKSGPACTPVKWNATARR